MGAYYQAVVLEADPSKLIRQLSKLAAQFPPISFEAYRVTDRGIVVFGWREKGSRHLSATDEMEKLAKVLSRKFGTSVAIHRDDMFQVYDATLYRRGKSIRDFGEEDELWAPVDSNGDMLPNASRCPSSAIPEDEDDGYGFVWSGIDAGLEAAGFRSWLPEPDSELTHVAFKHNLIWEQRGANW